MNTLLEIHTELVEIRRIAEKQLVVAMQLLDSAQKRMAFAEQVEQRLTKLLNETEQ